MTRIKAALPSERMTDGGRVADGHAAPQPAARRPSDAVDSALLAQGKRLLNLVKGRLSNVHVQGDKPNIFIFATPRSGSTFLIELLFAQPRMKIYDETLNLWTVRSRHAVGLDSWEALATLADRESFYRRYFTRLEKNRIPSFNPPLYRPYSRFLTRRIAYKVLYAGNDLIGWFEDEFQARIVVLVRHPIATVQSHVEFPRLPHFLRQPAYRAQFAPAQVELAERIIARGSPFERGILDWCLQIAPMIRRPRPSWAVISYEDLMTFPEPSFAYLSDKLDLDPVPHLWDIVATPSRSTSYSDAETQKKLAEIGRDRSDRAFLVNKWRKRAAEGDEARAFEIVTAFGIDAYEPGNDFATAKYRVPGVG
jgi:hypothetical protein